MRATTFTLVASLTLLAPACSPPDLPPGMAGDTAAESADGEVREAFSALLEAMNAGDPEAVLGFYLDDPRFVYLGCTEYIVGGSAFRQMVAPFYGREDRDSFELAIVSARALGTDAVVVNARGRSTSAPSLFVTQAWTRVDRGWRIALVHESWPGCREPRDPHPFTSPSGEAPLRPAEPGS